MSYAYHVSNILFRKYNGTETHIRSPYTLHADTSEANTY